REVALKLPRPEVLMTAEMRRRFVREAQAAAALDHPHIVPVYEAGELSPLLYIASAYCPGPTLAAWIRDQTESIPFPVAADLVGTLATAVAHAHHRGIWHRDLKPSNVLLQMSETEGSRAEGQPGKPGTSEPQDTNALALSSQPSALRPRITDFGLAKVVEHSDAETQIGVIMGTPPYMAPEQAEGRYDDLGEHTDVYALGAILYELLTRQPPFRGNSTMAILRQVVDEEPVRPKACVKTCRATWRRFA
ncbi:MAG: serine/threonine protein kinase, partial [Planctomycetes bacterium]|nr:serine/threonine protein kinase [Planctomycetota bacterium]